MDIPVGTGTPFFLLGEWRTYCQILGIPLPDQLIGPADQPKSPVRADKFYRFDAAQNAQVGPWFLVTGRTRESQNAGPTLVFIHGPDPRFSKCGRNRHFFASSTLCSTKLKASILDNTMSKQLS